MSVNKQLMKGSLQTVVLQILSKKSMHGYEISTQLKAESEGQFTVTEGTLYPLLHTLEADKVLASEVIEMGKRKRKVYKITEKGRKLLKVKKKEWFSFLKTMENMIASRGKAEA